jgi:hypothetical protein
MKITTDESPDAQASSDGHWGGALRAEVEQAQVLVPVVSTGLTAAQVQELAESRVAGLFHLSNMDHPVQLALRQLCVNRLAKKLRKSL